MAHHYREHSPRIVRSGKSVSCQRYLRRYRCCTRSELYHSYLLVSHSLSFAVKDQLHLIDFQTKVLPKPPGGSLQTRTLLHARHVRMDRQHHMYLVSHCFHQPCLIKGLNVMTTAGHSSFRSSSLSLLSNPSLRRL
jgi:hypothetical protein